MSYQVLARKWRPRNFAEVLGQSHVLKALTNALDGDRLHHAYLFTGTRGVGKTTLARVLAKALNCERGVSSSPCGACSACTSIDEGRFVDLIEVDAASRTKVDDTRDLLDNVPYAPASGRFKVYLIDEVHMFSNHSFNALLKTLEEPPDHVKFLLATTDPKKIPVTILSRCLQFNLTRLSTTQLEQHLASVLEKEAVPYEPEVLALLARAADGSVRDSLSLLDQAIAHGGGALRGDEVARMLGTVARDRIIGLVEILAQGDAPKLVQAARQLAEYSPDYGQVLAEILSLLQRVAVVHALGAQAAEVEDDARVIALAGAVPADECQLFYQIALNGRRDLALTPDPECGFEMVLLRMLAFRPAPLLPENEVSFADGASATALRQPAPQMPAQPAAAPTLTSTEEVAPDAPFAAAAEASASGADPVDPAPASPTAPAGDPQLTAHERPPRNPDDATLDWNSIVEELGVVGLVRELARNSALVASDGRRMELAIAPQFEKLAARRHVEALQGALGSFLGHEVRVEVRIDEGNGSMTPTQQREAEREQRQREAEADIASAPEVKALQESFGAVVEDISPR